jgi:hypothetical protein
VLAAIGNIIYSNAFGLSNGYRKCTDELSRLDLAEMMWRRVQGIGIIKTRGKERNMQLGMCQVNGIEAAVDGWILAFDTHKASTSSVHGA